MANKIQITLKLKQQKKQTYGHKFFLEFSIDEIPD